MKKIIDFGWKTVIGWLIVMTVFIIVGYQNPWAALIFVEGDPIPREWLVDSVIALKEWRCMNSDEYRTTGVVADVLLGEGAGNATREALCDHYNEYDFWGTIGFGR